MTDFLDKLREAPDGAPPAVDAIRSRARGIQRRRYVLMSGASAVVLVLAGIGLFTRTNHNSVRRNEAAVTRQEGGGSNSTLSGASGAASSGTTSADTAAAPKAAQPENRASEGFSSAAGKLSAAQSAPMSPPLTLTVSAPKRDGTGQDFAMKVCNNNAYSVSRNFNTSQRYDFEVDQNGSVVWKWSDGQVFAQHTGAESWAAHACKTYAGTWDGMTKSGAPARPGTYTVTGVLTSSPAERTKPVSFCQALC